MLLDDPRGIEPATKRHANKKYKHKPESILGNVTHKILKGFEMQTDNKIPAKSRNLELINKKKTNCILVAFTVLVDHRVKKKPKDT